MADTQSAAKLLIRVGDDYVFSRKRTTDLEDDKKLELIGGRIDHGETPSEAAQRELEEEESSGTLASAFARASSPTRIVAIGRPQWVFRLEINEPEWKRLRHSGESYGFVRVPRQEVESAKVLSKNLSNYTRMTAQIFAKLGMAD